MNVKEEINKLINQLQSETEIVNGNEWQSGFNNGLSRAVELLCNLENKL